MGLAFEVLFGMALIVMTLCFSDDFRFVLDNLRVNFILCAIDGVLSELVCDRVTSQD